MKKIVSLLVASFMLLSMILGVSADSVQYARYYADMSSLASYVVYAPNGDPSGFRTNFTPESDPTVVTGTKTVSGTFMGKASGDQVMMMGVQRGPLPAYFNTLNGRFDPDNNTDDGIFVGYQEGDKAHMSAQIYIPAGLGYYAESNPGPYMSLSLCDGSSTTSVKPTTATITDGNDRVVTFKQTSAAGGEILFLGKATAETWSADTRYTVDTVVTFGEHPTLSVYINGKPIALPDGVTADGTATTTEHVKLNYDSYGIMNCTILGIITEDNPAGPTVVYTDEWIFQNLRASEEPQLYNPVSIVGITDGANIDIDKFTTLNVDTDGMEMDEVTLYINEEEISTLTGAPYTFNIPSGLKAGKTDIRVVAVAGGNTFTREISINLIMMYQKQVMYENFDAYTTQTDASNAGWYSPSTRESEIATGNGWFLIPAEVKDKNNRLFGSSFKMGVMPGADPCFFIGNSEHTQIHFGYKKINGAAGGFVEKGAVVLEYKQYLVNKNMDCLRLSNTEQGMPYTWHLYEWDADSQKIKWNVSPAVYTDPKLNEWETYRIELDMTTATPKIALFIDGENVFSDAIMGSSVPKIDILTWSFAPNEFENGNFLALDEVKMTYTIERPRFKSITFHKGADTFTDTLAVPADVDTIQITTEGTNLNEEKFAENISLLENGTELSYEIDGEEKPSEVMLKDNNIWIVPVRPLRSDAEYTVLLKSTALFDTSKAQVGYDLDYSFSTAYKSLDVKDITFYKNGVEIEDISSVTFASNDKLKAKFTMCNADTLDKDVVLLLMGYNGNRLTLPGIKADKVSAEETDQVLESAEITITDPTNFSATATVWDCTGTIRVPALGAHIGR